MFLHFLDIVGEVDEPLAPLRQALVALPEVLLKLLEECVQLGHVLRDRGQGQGQDCQNDEMFESHLKHLSSFSLSRNKNLRENQTPFLFYRKNSNLFLFALSYLFLVTKRRISLKKLDQLF